MFNTLGCVLAVSLTLGLSEAAVAQLVLYDNFNSQHLDPDKWIGERSSPEGSDANRREVTVGVVGAQQNRRLRILETLYTINTDDNGDGPNGFGLGFAEPTEITAVSFTLTVDKEFTVGCVDNPDFGFALAGFFGDYFNPTGALVGASGDIVASIGVSRFWTEPANTLDVTGSISRCDDPKCDNQAILYSQELGQIQLGSTNTLSAAWDRPNHQFVFQLNNNPVVDLAYSVPDRFPPGLPDKSFFVYGDVPHCTATPRPTVSIDALFGNVYVNP